MNTASGLLPYLGLLRFSGPDAAGFLQGQISADTRRLGAGEPLFAAYSSPQGRVLALLHLFPHSSGILAALPRELVGPTLQRLRQFVMRAKVRIEDVGGQLALGGVHGDAGLAAAHLAPPETTGYAERDGVGVARVGPRPSANSRYWVVGDPAALAAHGLDGDSGTAERDWRLADIREGLPQVYALTQELFVAQMLNLDLLDGISFTKGCYTGQEIVARTQHLGRIKRRLYRLRLPPGSWTLAQPVRASDGRQGRLTEWVSTPDGVDALAVLPIAATDEDGAGAADAAAADAPTPTSLQEIPLPYPLAAPV